MKKKILSIAMASLLLAPLAVSAQIGGQPGNAPTVDVMKALDSITNWLFVILIVIAVISIIIAAYFFITAQGDADKVGKARQFVLYALIGVAVAILAKGLVLLVLKIVNV